MTIRLDETKCSLGMAGIFGTPLAAVMISVELLLFEYRPLSLVCVGLASFVSDCILNIISSFHNQL